MYSAKRRSTHSADLDLSFRGDTSRKERKRWTCCLYALMVAGAKAFSRRSWAPRRWAAGLARAVGCLNGAEVDIIRRYSENRRDGPSAGFTAEGTQPQR